MRNLIIALAALSFMCTSCTHKPINPIPGRTFGNNIIGKWKWVKSHGSIAGITTYPAAGEQRSLLFRSDSIMVTTETNSTATHTTTATFSITTNTPVYDGFTYQLTKDNIYPNYSFKFSGDTLVLQEYMICDGFVHWYVRDQVTTAN